VTDYRVTPAGAGDKNGTSWAHAMGYAEWEAYCEGTPAAGDRFFVAGGTYTLTSNFACAAAGTAAANIWIIGVKSTTTNENPIYSDWATGADRPVIVCGAAYRFTNHNYWQVHNIEATGSAATVLTGQNVASHYGVWRNCKSTNSSDTANRSAFAVGGYSRMWHCEAVSTAGRAIAGLSSTLLVYLDCCYAHDSNDGIYLGLFYVNNCIVASCANYGIYISSSQSAQVRNTLVYNCEIGIRHIGDPAPGYGVFVNNIILDCTTGVYWTAADHSSLFDYNCFYGNTTARTNVDPGPNDIATDPKVKTNTPNIYTLQADSSCFNTGMKLGALVGLT